MRRTPLLSIDDSARIACAAPTLFGVGVAVLATLLPARADATQSFPGVVQRHYGLMQVAVDPPQGCKLCHVDDSGGVTLSPFGLLLSSEYGVRPYDEGSLEKALSALDAQNSVQAQDIKMGIDPNAQTISNETAPEYGCATTPNGPAASGWGALAALPIALRLSRRRAARRT